MSLRISREVAGLVGIATVLHLIWALAIGFGNDEAYHTLYAAHPSLSYHDHPPMLAWVQYPGLALLGPSHPLLAHRLGFVLLFAGSTVLLARIGTRLYGPSAGLFAALALNLSGYFGVAASTFVLPDGPLLFFWLLTLDRLLAALDAPDGRLTPWVLVGLAWGAALLSKYQAIFLPAGMLVALALPGPSRRRLRQPGPYLAVVIGLLVFSPVLYWNATHGWGSFRFQAGRATGSLRVRPELLAQGLVLPIVYLLPWIGVPLMVRLVRGLRGWRTLADGERLVVALAAVPLFVFLPVAALRPTLPHWWLIGTVGLFPMLGRDWAARWAADRGRFRRTLTLAAAVPLTIGLIGVTQYRTGWLTRGSHSGIGFLSPATDPTAEAYGWDQIAAQLQARGLLDDPDTFLYTNRWYKSAHLALAVGRRAEVLCYHPNDMRGYTQWNDSAAQIGRDGILVLEANDRGRLPLFTSWFDTVEPLGTATVTRGGARVREVALYRCRTQRVAVVPVAAASHRRQ